MSEQSVPEREPARPTDPVAAEDVVAVADPGSRTGQVLGQSVPIPPAAAVAEPTTPETGAVRDEEGRPTSEKPYT